MPSELRDSRPRGWFHIDNVVVDAYLPIIGHTPFALYSYLVRRAAGSRVTWPSYTMIQDALGIGRGQVAHAVKTLVAHGLVRIEKGKRSANIYHIEGVTGSDPELVPIQNQSRIETGTSSDPEPELVPIQNPSPPRPPSPGERPNYQDNSLKRERVINPSHAPARARASPLIPCPDPFVPNEGDGAFIREQGFPLPWVKRRSLAFANHYATTEKTLTEEGWHAKWRKWILDDWEKEQQQTKRR